MAGPFAALERFFERLFERPAARLFGTRLQPVQLQRRLERAMEAERRYGADRTYVPNTYTLLLHPEDFAGFAGYQASLEAELADALLARARRQGYTLLERPTVRIAESAEVSRRDARVTARVLDPLLLRPAPEGFRRVPDSPGARRAAFAGRAAAGVSGSGPRVARESAAGSAHAGPESPGGELDGPSDTAVFATPAPAPTHAVLSIHAPGQPTRRVPLPQGAFRIGRASDNDLALADERVSRYHGQVVARQGALVYTDLGSTNGSYVNGTPVTEIALGPGDVLQVGNSSLTIEPGA